MAIENHSYIGKGMIHGRLKGSNTGFMPWGNCSALNFAVATNKEEQPDYTSAGGGAANTVDRITGVTAEITQLDLSPENIARATRGTVTEVTTGQVTGEAHAAYKGALVPLDFQPDPDLDLTVTSDDGATTYEEGVDYDRSLAGIRILEDGGIPDSADGAPNIKVDYSKVAAAVVEALVEAGQEFELVFDGLNEARSGKAVTLRVHRLKFNPTSGLNFLGDSFGELPSTCDVLSDPSVTGAGLSKFFKVAMQR